MGRPAAKCDWADSETYFRADAMKGSEGLLALLQKHHTPEPAKVTLAAPELPEAAEEEPSDPLVEAPPPDVMKDWVSSQLQKYKPLWFGIEREVDPPKPLVDDVLRATCRHYNKTRQEIRSERRTGPLIIPRQVGMFLSKELTGRSLPEIGRRFGGRDHTTVLYAVNKIASLAQTDAQIAADVEAIKQALGVSK